MIAFLSGQSIDEKDDKIVFLVSNIGYELNVSAFTKKFVSGKRKTCLWVQNVQKENLSELYAFYSKEEKEVFLHLIKVSGIGPKMAVKMLSFSEVSELVSMIIKRDIENLVQIPGIGRKKAEQICIACKDKFNGFEVRTYQNKKELVLALKSLGFYTSEINSYLDKIPPNMNLKQAIRFVLQNSNPSH